MTEGRSDLSQYLIPSDDISMAVGRVVLAAARLEFEARHFALELGQKPVPYDLKKLVSAIKRSSKVFPESEQIDTWADHAYALWGFRGRLAHGAWLDVWDEVDPTKHGLLSQKDWNELPIDPEELDLRCEEILEATMEVIEIINALRRRSLENAPAWGGPFGMPPLIPK